MAVAFIFLKPKYDPECRENRQSLVIGAAIQWLKVFSALVITIKHIDDIHKSGQRKLPELHMIIRPDIPTDVIAEAALIMPDYLLGIPHEGGRLEDVGMNDEVILRPARGITEFRGEYPFIVWLIARQQAENMRLTERVIIEAQSIMVVSFGQHIRIAGLTMMD